MSEAQQLIFFREDSTRFEINERALQALCTLISSKPVRVTAIAGPSRTGKSFLANCLCGAHRCFGVGHLDRPQTRGVWFTVKEEEAMSVYIDIEGLYDIERRNPELDMKFLALACSIANTVILNMKVAIDEQILITCGYSVIKLYSVLVSAYALSERPSVSQQRHVFRISHLSLHCVMHTYSRRNRV